MLSGVSKSTRGTVAGSAGTLSAVLILVFQDTLLSLVAGIQLNRNGHGKPTLADAVKAAGDRPAAL